MLSSYKFSTEDQKAFGEKNPNKQGGLFKNHFDGVGEVTCNTYARWRIGSVFKPKLLGCAKFKKTPCYNL